MLVMTWKFEYKMRMLTLETLIMDAFGDHGNIYGGCSGLRLLTAFANKVIVCSTNDYNIDAMIS